jgi:hypothetical protein
MKVFDKLLAQNAVFNETIQKVAKIAIYADEITQKVTKITVTVSEMANKFIDLYESQKILAKMIVEDRQAINELHELHSDLLMERELKLRGNSSPVKTTADLINVENPTKGKGGLN